LNAVDVVWAVASGSTSILPTGSRLRLEHEATTGNGVRLGHASVQGFDMRRCAMMRSYPALVLFAVAAASACSKPDTGGSDAGEDGGSEAASTFTVSPSAATLVPGSVVRFVAERTFDGGTAINVSAQAVWSAEPSDVVTVDGGVVLALKPGQGIVTARLDDQMASTAVTVKQVDGLVIADGSLVLDEGRVGYVGALVRYTDGTTEDVSERSNWTSSAPSKAWVSTIAGSRGWVRAVSSGTAAIEVTFGALSATGTVTVTAPTVIRLAVDPATMTLVTGTPQLIREVSAIYSNGTSLPVSASVTWTSSNAAAAVVEVPTGQLPYVNPLSPGMTAIEATLPLGPSASLMATVVAGAPASVSVVPGYVVMPVGMMEILDAVVLHDSGATSRAWNGMWNSSYAAIATVKSVGGKVELTALSQGMTTVTVFVDGLMAKLTVQVDGQTLARLKVGFPWVTQLPPNFPLRLTAGAVTSSNHFWEVTTTSAWTSSNPEVANVDSSGRVVAGLPGFATIRAEFNGAAGSTQIEVFNAVLSSVAVSPATAVIPVQTTALLSASGLYGNGMKVDLREVVTWSSDAPAIAEVSNVAPFHGRVTGRSAGTATIRASWGKVQATSQVVVSP
jgi:hypothetical protein